MSKIDISDYTSYRMSIERVLGGEYVNSLRGEVDLPLMLTTYMVHSFLEGRSHTDCAMKIREKFPLVKNDNKS